MNMKMTIKNNNIGGLQQMIIVSIIVVAVTSVHYVHGSILKTDSIPSKCVVRIDDQELLKEIGDKWITNDTCIKHSCEVDDHGTPYEKLTKEICSNQCTNETKEYEIHFHPEKCCGECIKTKCSYEKNIYEIGDTWRSSDNCTLLECSEHNNEAFILEYKKKCPRIPNNCTRDGLYKENCCWYCDRKDNKQQQESKQNNNNSNTASYSYEYKMKKSYKNHPCKRECIDGAEPMTCHYKFDVEWYETLSKACYDCPHNVIDCYRPDCVVGDGKRRSIIVVNRMMPGPAIEVCYNDTIIVDVENLLLGDTTTIHWHGIQQRDTPYMDGVPHVTQCPIEPHTTFRYIFKANHPGTHFWHSHTGMQRGDGCFGALIIRQPISKDPQSEYYDFDLSEHTIMVQDWAHSDGISMFVAHHHSMGTNKPTNILVNGLGRYYKALQEKNLTSQIEVSTLKSDITTESSQNDKNGSITIISSNNDTKNNTDFEKELMKKESRAKRSIENPFKFPLSEFRVKHGFSYRFRVINAEFLNCPMAISIDNHTLLVINSDGYDLEPVEVSTLVIYAGERFDFALKADQNISNYWIRFKGLMDCGKNFTAAHQAAILRYEGANENEEPLGLPPTYDYTIDGLELNPLNKGPGYVDSLVISELNAQAEDDDWNHQEKPDYKFYIYYDFYPKDNPHFHVPNLYGFNQVKYKSSRLNTPQLNHISLKFPSLPLLPARDKIDESQFCNASSLQAEGIDCRKQFCECSHVLQVKLGSIVEIVLIDEGVSFDANHPFHLHGYTFRVLGMDRIRTNVSFEEVREMDKLGLLTRRFHKSPIKDTVTVPDGGYTIIRFKADNPGFWLFHCHIEFHAEIGMAVVLKIGDNNQMAPVPESFPTCSNYMPKKSEIIGRNSSSLTANKQNINSAAASTIATTTTTTTFQISLSALLILLLSSNCSILLGIN